MKSKPVDGVVGFFVCVFFCWVFVSAMLSPVDIKAPQLSLAKTEVLPSIKSPETLIELIARISFDHGIDPALTKAIVHRESSFKADAVRVEKGIYDEFTAKYPDLSKDERLGLATSWGLMQVMGFNAKLCELYWEDLRDPEKNVRCGLTLLKNYLQKYDHVRSDTERLRLALVRYNGIGPAAERYAQLVIKQFHYYKNVG